MSLVWGATFPAGRVVALELPPYTAGVLRMFFTLAVLIPLQVRISGQMPRLDRRGLITVIALGASGLFAYNALLITGMKLVTASRAALIVPLNATVTPVALWLLFGERLTPLQLAGVVIAFAGSLLAVTQGDFGMLLEGGVGTGELLLFGCLASWVVFTLISRSIPLRLSVLAASTYAAIAAFVLFAVAACFELSAGPAAWPSAAVWFCVVFLGIFGSGLSVTWYNEGIRAIGAGKTAVFINLVPIFGVALGVILLSEPLAPSLALGALLVFVGVALTNRPSS